MITRIKQVQHTLALFLAAPVFSEDETKTRVARLLNAILTFVPLIGMILPLMAAFVAPDTLLLNLAVAIVLAGGMFGLLLLLRVGRVQLTSILLSSLFLALVTAGVLMFGGIRSAVAKTYLLVILMAGLLMGARGAVIFGLLSVFSSFAAYYAETHGLIAMPHVVSGLGDYFVLIAVFALMALLLSFALSSIATGFQRARQAASELAERNRELEQAHRSLERRTFILQVVTDVSTDIAEMLDPEELVHRVVDVVCERFSLYYVGLFLVEEQDESLARFAVLRAGTGDAGREMLAANHRLMVGGDSMIGQCVATGEARIELDVRSAMRRYANPLLPETLSELALPLRSRGRVIGGMTVQSREVEAFADEDVTVMQTLADQVAAAIDNARLYTEAQEAAELSQRIVRRYVEESWDTLIEQEAVVSDYRYATKQAESAEDLWLPTTAEAVRQQDPVIDNNSSDALLTVPLVQNEVVIGVVNLRRPGGEPWDADELALAQAVGQQMTQALENRRLFQVARERARRERVLRQTTDRVRSQANLDTVLQVAAQEMRRVVGATHVAIRLGTESLLDAAERAQDRGQAQGRAHTDVGGADK